MITKKNILIIGLIGTVLFLLLTFATEIGICDAVHQSCFEIYDKFAEVLFIFIPVFILSLITYKMQEKVFQSWLKFTYAWVPLSIILTLLAPEYDASLVSITKGIVSFSMSAIFLLVSFIAILIKQRKFQ